MENECDSRDSRLLDSTLNPMKYILLSLALLTCLPLTGCVVQPRPYGPRRAIVVEEYGRRPYPGAVWVSGCWVWRHHHRVWEPGHWRR